MTDGRVEYTEDDAQESGGRKMMHREVQRGMGLAVAHKRQQGRAEEEGTKNRQYLSSNKFLCKRFTNQPDLTATAEFYYF